MGEYRKAAIIKYTRMALGLTQEELSENICDPVTLSRYENGQIDPTDDKFMRLMNKMGTCGDVFLLPVDCEAYEIEKSMKELLYALEEKQWNKVENLLNLIKTKYKLSMEYPENIQYIKRIELILKYSRQEIGNADILKELIAVFQITFPDCLPDNFPIKKVIREPELLLLYNIATFYVINHNIDQALAIFERLDQYFNRCDVINNYKHRYLAYLAYANLLGNIGKYDESITICKQEISWLLKHNQVNFLYNFYYNIGWNIRKKIENGLLSHESTKEAKVYIWLAYQLCLQYPENKNNLPKIIEALKSFEGS